MNKRTPRELAFYTALIISVSTTIVFGLVSLISGKTIDFKILTVTISVLMVVSFLSMMYVLEKFIHRKVKLIYKTIHNLKTSKTDNFNIDLSKDVLKDVNEQVQSWAEDQSKQIKQLKEQEAFRREFLGNLAHELKTPIFSIQGYLLTLLEGGLEDPSINQKFLKRAAKGTDRMIDIVEDLDTIAKYESQQLILNINKINIVENIIEVIESLEHKIKKKNIQVKIKGGREQIVMVEADSNRINQVITNLIANSINYGNEDGFTEIRLYDLDENILIEVADDGQGIPQEYLSRLFERFYRVDKSRSRNQGGTGLGLAIVKHIIEAHQQTVNVRSSVGKGSTFSFTLRKVK